MSTLAILREFMRPPRVWHLLLLLASASALVVGPRPLTASGQNALSGRAAVLLDRYDRGERNEVVDLLTQVRDVPSLRDELKDVAGTWTTAAGRPSEVRRRLVAATVALELANAKMDSEWVALRELVEWGCELLRRGGPSDAERIWQRASIALAGGALDDALLYRTRTGLRVYDHASHAEARFPDDSRIAFARRFAVPAGAIRGSLTLVPGPEPPFDAPASGRSRLPDYDDAIRELMSLVGDPDVGAEAALRAAHLQLIRLNLSDAIEVADTARARTTSPYVVYLAEFLKGRAYERMSRLDDAANAYALAARALPGAQSATLASGALLVRRGRAPEATRLVAASLFADARVEDPWRLFTMGDYYRWRLTLSELRKAIDR